MSGGDYIVLELPRGEGDVLRVTRRMYEGRPFTDVRVHFRGSDGQMHPTKKGTSIRDGEIAAVVEALNKISSKVGSQSARDLERRPIEERPRRSSPRPAPGGSGAQPGSERSASERAEWDEAF